MTVLNEHAVDIQNGWIETDPDTQQRILPPKGDVKCWTVRQQSCVNPELAIEGLVWIEDLSEDEITVLLDEYGYDSEIREDSSFNQLLAEMEFESNILSSKEAEIQKSL